MRLSGQFRVYFFYKKILHVKKNTKTENKWFSPSLKFLCSQKIVAFVVFYSLIFVLLLGFCLWRVYDAQNLFLKKKKNKQAQNCPDSLIYNTTFSYQKLTQTWSMPLITMYRAVVLQLLVNSKHRSSYCPTPIHLFWTYSELF